MARLSRHERRLSRAEVVSRRTSAAGAPSRSHAWRRRRQRSAPRSRPPARDRRTSRPAPTPPSPRRSRPDRTRCRRTAPAASPPRSSAAIARATRSPCSSAISPALGSGRPFASGIRLTSPIAKTPSALVASVPASTPTQPWPATSPRVGHDGGRTVRRHRQEQIERLLAAVGEHDAAGLDALRLRADPARDPTLGELAGHPLRPRPARVRHQHRLQRDDRQLRPVAKSTLPEVSVEVERALVRCRRAGVRGAGDQDQQAAALELPQGGGCARHAGEGPDVMAVLGQAGHEIGSRDRSEPDHEVVALEPATDRLGSPRGRVDREDLVLDDADPVMGEQRSRRGCRRRPSRSRRAPTACADPS